MFKSRSQVHNRQTRSSGALDIPLCRLSTGQRSFAFRGAKLWNSLNDNIKSLKCPRNFRRHLANVLLSWYIFCNYNIIVLTFLINLYHFVFFILLSWKAHFGSINKVYVCMYVCMYIKDSSNFPINDLRSDVIFSTSLKVKTLSAIWACSFLRAALNLIAHYWCFVYATCWSLCYQILIVDYFNTLRFLLSFNAQ